MAQAEPDEPLDLATASLAEINRRLENPLTTLWSWIYQGNVGINRGDLIDGSETSQVHFFQPALPVPIGDDKVFIARPVIPYVDVPVLDPSSPGGVNGSESGLGDMQLFTVLGPSRTDGIVWGLGATFKLPTASDPLLGQEKWQVGPAALIFSLKKPWTLGVLAQHWWSVAGDDDRAAVSQTDIQYVARRQMGNGWSLGMGPTITIDWKADSDNRLTIPVGLGVTKTVRIGKVPVKLRFEPQYSIVRPDDFSAEWNIRFQVAVVTPSPFSR